MVKTRLFVLIISFMLLLCHAANAFGMVPVSIQAIDPEEPIGAYIQLVEDSDKTLTIEKLISDRSIEWSGNQSPVLNFSFSQSAYWIRLSLVNSQSTHQHYVLYAAMPLHDYFDFYEVKNGKIEQHVKTGDRLPYETRMMPHRSFPFPIDFDANESKEIYLRVDTHDGLYDALPIFIMPKETFFHASDHEYLIYGFYYGAIIALLLYNFLVYISTREKMFLYYSIYLLAFALWNFTFRGYAFAYLWPHSPIINNQAVAVLSIGIYISFILFTVNYLETKKTSPRNNKILRFALVINILALIPCFLGHYAISFAIIMPLGIATLLLIMSTAVYLFFKGYRTAKFFLLAWSALILGAIIYYLRVFGLVPSNFITENILNIASFFEYILLAFALADKINVLSSEKLAAEQLALKMQRDLNTQLDHLVEERTKALEVANVKLQELSITDELTGLYNRRYFNQMAENELLRAKRDKKIFIFSIMDIDHFKRYNDRYGHHNGDKVLRSIGKVMGNTMKRASDFTFRLGGEEFGIMFTAESIDDAENHIECIRTEIEGLNIEHEGNLLGIVTASFGACAVFKNENTDLKSLYASADSALYKAKEAGRNRVIFA